MLLEPPRPHLPPGHGLSATAALRLGAAAAALVLAALSQGDAVVLAALLAVAAWRPIPAVALGAALVASSWRWGSTSLEALSGAQAVLGPAGLVGPRSAAAASWLAAIAVVLAATRALPEGRGMGGRDGATDAPNLVWRHDRIEIEGTDVLETTAGAQNAEPEVGGKGGPGGAPGAPNLRRSLGSVDVGAVVLAVAAGATAAAIVAGPAPGGAWLARIAAAVIASALALGISVLRRRRPSVALLLDAGAGVAAVAALAAAAVEAGAWSGTVSSDALREGIAVALASGALVVVGALASAAVGAQRT